MLRRIHILLFAACCVLLCAALHAAGSRATAPAAPVPGRCAALVDPSAAEWLCERAGNSDLALPRPAGELLPSQGLSCASRALFLLPHFRFPTHARGVGRAAAYRSVSDSRPPSGADLSVRLRRLLI